MIRSFYLCVLRREECFAHCFVFLPSFSINSIADILPLNVEIELTVFWARQVLLFHLITLVFDLPQGKSTKPQALLACLLVSFEVLGSKLCLQCEVDAAVFA